MRLIKSYSFPSLADWYRAETRIFRLFSRFSIDELKDIAEYQGILHHNKNKATIIKTLMVEMRNTLSNEHFSKLKLK